MLLPVALTGVTSLCVHVRVHVVSDTNVLRYIQLTEMKMSKSSQRERESGKETQG